MSSFTIEKKLFIGVGVLVLFTFALGLTAIINISGIGDRVATIVGPTMQKKTLAHQMETQSSDLLAEDRGILVRGYMKDAEAMQKYNQQFTATADAMQKNIDTIRPLLVTAGGKAAAADLQGVIGSMRQANQAVFESSMAGNMDAATTAQVNNFLPVQKRVKGSTDVLLKACDDLFATTGLATESSIIGIRWVTGFMLVLTCCVGITLFFVIRQINRLLCNSVTELAESAVQIASAAGQVSASSQSLAQGSSEQAATIEETSSVSTEINSMAQRNTENSHSTAEMVSRSQDDFARTNQSLTEMVDAMDGITASSQKISKIIKVIDEIAFQTNILALNAAVEAARAGEAGMGFAVVAEEVRSLAQRCAQAAKDTADLIEESIQRSNGGKLKVDEVAVAIRAITAESSKIKALVDEINLGSVEQSRGIDQISRSITQMEQVTQSNAANAEESAAAAEELNAQAEAMKDIVRTLQSMVNAGRDSVQTSHRDAQNPRTTEAKPIKLAASTPITKSITKIKSVVKFPAAKTPASVRAKASNADTAFPMDDDFKEF